MTPIKNLPLFMNLCYYGFNRGLDPNGDFHPNPDGTTHCNQFVQFVLNGFGYDKCNGKNANEMVDFLSNFENGWISPADEGTVQSHANNGVITIAGWKNLSGHGHVCLLVPGLLEKSLTYGKAVPKCVNVGVEVFFGKRISQAFAYERAPAYFALCDMI